MIKTPKVYTVSAILFILVLYFSVNENIKAQSCGFGCLGLSGVYGGYTFQEFKADGINSFVSTSDNFEFNKGEGFRIGTNLFRAQFDDYFITAKGFFQFINEEYKTSDLLNSVGEEYQLKHNYWGVGVDFGIPLFSIVDWKIVEGGVTFLNVELKTNQLVNEVQISESKFENKKLDVGYYVASGIIIHIIKDYISLEGTASYNIYKVDEFVDDNGNNVAIESGKSFIENKGVTATVQLNLGFPL